MSSSRVSRQCELLGKSRSCYYYRPRVDEQREKQERADIEITEAIHG